MRNTLRNNLRTLAGVKHSVSASTSVRWHNSQDTQRVFLSTKDTSPAKHHTKGKDVDPREADIGPSWGHLTKLGVMMLRVHCARRPKCEDALKSLTPVRNPRGQRLVVLAEVSWAYEEFELVSYVGAEFALSAKEHGDRRDAQSTCPYGLRKPLPLPGLKRCWLLAAAGCQAGYSA